MPTSARTELGSFLSTVDECFDRVAADASADLPKRKNAIETLAWVSLLMSALTRLTPVKIARGLIVRSDSRGYALLDKLLSLFEHPQVGRIAARSLEIIGQDDSEVLSKANFSVIKVKSPAGVVNTELMLAQSYCTSKGSFLPPYQSWCKVIRRLRIRQSTSSRFPSYCGTYRSSCQSPSYRK